MERPPPPPGCEDIDAHEREFTALATALQAQALEMLKSDGRIDVATGKELALASIRARAVASDLALARAERDNDSAIFSEYKRMRGGDVPPRPRLRRVG